MKSFRHIGKIKFFFIALLSFVVISASGDCNPAWAGIIDQVNAASDGDTVVITEAYLKPFTWAPTQPLRSEQLDINSSIILKGDVKQRIECVQLRVNADDVTINRFEFSHLQNYCNAEKNGQIDKRSREDRADSYDYNELLAADVNNLTITNCDFKDNNIYYETWERPDPSDGDWGWSLIKQAKTMGGLANLQRCDTVVFKNCTFDNASAYKGGLLLIKNCSNVIFEDCSFSSGMGFYGGGLINIDDSTGISFVRCQFDGGATIYTEDGGLLLITGSSDISFTDCTLKNGYASNGGGFYISGSDNCSFSGCTIKKCQVYDVHHFWINSRRYLETGYDGGGGYVYNCTNLSIDGCSFTDNSAVPFQNDGNNFVNRSWIYTGCGGALIVGKTSDIKINNTSFSGNRAYEGGSLWLAGSDLVMTGCDFSENTADSVWVVSQLMLDIIGEVSAKAGKMHGDAERQAMLIKIAKAVLTFSSVPDDVRDYLSKETLGPEGGIGGALYAAGSSIRIAGSSFDKNSVQRRGGAIYLVSSGSETELVEIQTTLFSENYAAQKGGALMNLQPGVKIDNCLFQDNLADKMGGGIYSVEEITVADTELKENRATLGGAVCANIINSQHSFRDCLFTDNAAYNDMQEKKGEGGAIYAHGLKSDNIREPRSLMDLLDWLQIKTQPFNDLVPQDNNLKIDNCNFLRNVAYNGGALSLSYLNADCKDSVFSSNGALNHGGAVNNRDFANCNVGGCDFTNNQASANGGAVYNDGENGGKLLVNRTKFEKNKALAAEGGAIADHFGELKVTNSIFTANSTGLLQGSAIFTDRTNPAEVINCTLVANHTLSSVIRATNRAYVQLTNNIITSNKVVENVSDGDVTWNTDGSVVMSRNNICALNGPGDFPESASVMVAPLAGDNADFHLRSDFLWNGLGAMEKGYNAAIDTVWDFDGKTRIIDNDGDGTATVDLGAYEAHHVKIRFGDGHPINPLDIHGTVDESGLGDHEKPLHQWITYGDKPDYSLVNVIADPGWAHVGWETFTRNTIRPTRHKFYQGEKLYATYDHYPTAAYDFGLWGYYYDGTGYARDVWTTYDYDPLAEPPASCIKVNNGWVFLGWSETEGGAVINLPASISESASFYAVYEPRQVHLTFSQGYEPNPDPSGDYNYGTRLDLTDPGVVAVADCNPNGNYLAGFVYGEDDWNPDDQDRVNLSKFVLDEDVTISGVYSDIYASGKVFVVTDIEKGCINQAEAEACGFIVDANISGGKMTAFKTTPDGCEPVLRLITPYNLNFAGYTISSIPNAQAGFDLVLTAQYLDPEAHDKAQPCLLTLHAQAEPASKNGQLRAGDPLDYAALFVLPYGTLVDLTQAPYILAPEPGYRFVGWVDTNGNPLTVITITADLEIFAVFEPLQCLLTLQFAGNGIVEQPLLRTYDWGDAIQLSSFSTIPDQGFRFDHWEDEQGQELGGSFAIHDDCAITAVFAPKPYDLAVSIDGHGTIDASLPGSYPANSEVALYAHLAIPDHGYMFAGFYDENGDPADAVLMSHDRLVTARFTVEYFWLTLFLQDSGKIITDLFPAGTVVDLASYNGGEAGYVFTGFYDENGDPVAAVTMTGDRSIVAVSTTYLQANYSLQLVAYPGGTINGDSERWYPAGTTVDLSLVGVDAEAGYMFRGFVDESGNPITSVVMDSYHQATAVFEPDQGEAIPTLNPWGMMMLALLLIVSAVYIRTSREN